MAHECARVLRPIARCERYASQGRAHRLSLGGKRRFPAVVHGPVGDGEDRQPGILRPNCIDDGRRRRPSGILYDDFKMDRQ